MTETIPVHFKDMHDETTEPIQLDAIAKAMVEVQKSINGVAKDTKAYNYMYADLHACIEATKEALTSNGLCVIQTTKVRDDKNVVQTILLHESGQYITSETYVPSAKNDAQSIGSALTYARRYAYSAIVGLAQKDDDGVNAMPVAKKKQSSQPKMDKIVKTPEDSGIKATANSEELVNHAPIGKPYKGNPGDYQFQGGSNGGKCLKDINQGKLLAWYKWAEGADIHPKSWMFEAKQMIKLYLGLEDKIESSFDKDEKLPF